MKKYLSLFILFILMLFPSNIYASSKYIESDKILNLNNNIDNSFIALGETVNINNTVDGIYLVFGKDIKYNSSNNYVVLFGMNTNVYGSIKDGAIFSSSIVLENVNIERDIVLFGENVQISGNFNGNVVVFANEINVDNANISNNLITFSSSLNISSNTVINGKLKYYENTKTDIQSQNIGEVVIKKNNDVKIDYAVWIYNKIMSLVAFLVVFLVIYWIFPNKLDNFSNDIGSNFGYGALWLFITPIISIILMFTSVGSIIGIIIMLIYIITLLLSMIVSGYILGDYIWKKFLSKYEYKKYLVGVMGITILYLTTLIPIIGGIIILTTLLYSSGILVKILFKK